MFAETHNWEKINRNRSRIIELAGREFKVTFINMLNDIKANMNLMRKNG
jgi:hypothetical protein